MTGHKLDNPAYYGMISGNRDLSLGTEGVRYFPASVSPFVGMADHGAERFGELAGMLPRGQVAAVATAAEIVIPSAWKVVQHGMGLQMMGEGVAAAETGDWEFVPLRVEHVPQMVALAKLTNPGPFAERTIEFGNFVGVFDGERLMGMSGHRLHPVPYIEVSGVCVHPDYSGRGLGGALTLYQVEKIREMGELPILHVWASNTRAIGVYESLGFVTRTALHFNIIIKKP